MTLIATIKRQFSAAVAEWKTWAEEEQRAMKAMTPEERDEFLKGGTTACWMTCGMVDPIPPAARKRAEMRKQLGMRA